MKPSPWSSRTEITIDGRTYAGVQEMPPDVRARYEQAMRAFDRDGNGVPDVLEGASPDPNVISQVTTRQKIIVNGREYDSWNELPPELRSLLRPGASKASLGSIHFTGGALALLLVVAALLGAAVMWALLR